MQGSAESDNPKEPLKTEPKPTPEARTATTPNQPAICKCGRITAQPHYIVFDAVWGRLTHVQRRGISGVFCRSCADRTAIRASIITWLAGWWTWPNGPKETVKALLSNLRGGRKPPERNAKLLIRQSRAFRARGEMELAHNAAEQALMFAATPAGRGQPSSVPQCPSCPHLEKQMGKTRMGRHRSGSTPRLNHRGRQHDGDSFSAHVIDRHDEKPIDAGERRVSADWVSPSKKITEEVVGRAFSIAIETASLRTGPGSNISSSRC